MVTDWPTPNDYQQAIQYPKDCFIDSELKFATFEVDKFGFPYPVSGNFATVFRAKPKKGHDIAVRCFHRPPTDHRDRYQKISVYLSSLSRKPSSLVEFKYVEGGIKVKKNKLCPIVKMDWVYGDPLHIFVKGHLKDKRLMLDVSEKFRTLVKQLRDAHIAHGDLQHGNLLITKSFELKLVDYDGMYIPPLKGERSTEWGHSNYQHFLRNSSHFDENLDNFSSVVIYLSLRAIAIDYKLFEKFNNGDNLIFVKADFKDPKNSGLLNTLKNSNDRITRYCTNVLTSNITKNPNTFPSLEVTLRSI